MNDQHQLATRETLLRRVRNRHDEKSWEEFVSYYSRFLCNVIRRMNLSHHDAEEIVQKLNIKLWQKLPDFEYDSRKGRFRSWLCTLAVNEARMFLRQKKAELRRFQEGDTSDIAAPPDPGSMPDINTLAEEEWRKHVTSLAWERIQDKFESNAKNAFEMVSKGAPPKEVARQLGISQSSVYVYKKRVQDRLRAEIVRLNGELD